MEEYSQIEHSQIKETLSVPRSLLTLCPDTIHALCTNADNSPDLYLCRFVLPGHSVYFIVWRRWLIQHKSVSLLGTIHNKSIFFVNENCVGSCEKRWIDMGESHRQKVAWKKSDTEYLLRDSISMKFSVRQN